VAVALATAPKFLLTLPKAFLVLSIADKTILYLLAMIGSFLFYFKVS
jgi:hypothetical protein